MMAAFLKVRNKIYQVVQKRLEFEIYANIEALSWLMHAAPYLAVWSVARRGDHVVEVAPVHDLPLRHAPDAHLAVQRAADEVAVVHRVELHACYCLQRWQQLARDGPEQKNRDGIRACSACGIYSSP
jgi:hypothetical protein